MPSLPTPSRLPLASAIERIAMLTNVSLLHSDVIEAFHAALCEGALIVKGDQESRDGKVIHRGCEVPKEAWQEMSAHDFRRQYDRPRVIFYLSKGTRPGSVPFYFTNLTLSTAEIEIWLSSVQSKRGRPKGVGAYPDDAKLVSQAEKLHSKGLSKREAAMRVAGDPNAPTYNATVERLRKKIGKPANPVGKQS
jgi:hypothetical protein